MFIPRNVWGHSPGYNIPPIIIIITIIIIINIISPYQRNTDTNWYGWSL